MLAAESRGVRMPGRERGRVGARESAKRERSGAEHGKAAKSSGARMGGWERSCMKERRRRAEAKERSALGREETLPSAVSKERSKLLHLRLLANQNNRTQNRLKGWKAKRREKEGSLGPVLGRA